MSRQASKDVAIGRLHAPASVSWEAENGFVRGATYRVVKEFTDADGDTHQIGETWTLACVMFSKFDNEIQFGVDRGSERDLMIPLNWADKSQTKIIEQISDYVELA